SSLLMPDSEPDTRRAVDILTQLAAGEPSSCMVFLGAAHFRAGQDDAALARLNEALTTCGPEPHNSLAHAVLAMVHHRQGRIEDARQSLQKMAGVLDQWTQQRYENQERRWVIHNGALGAWPMAWWDYLEGQLWYREAKLMIDGTVPADDARLHVLRAR